MVTVSACRGCGRPEPQTASPTAVNAAAGTAVPASLSATALAIPSGPWTDLAKRLVEAKNLGDAVTVTREVLARGGVATFDGDRDIVAAIGPRAGFTATPRETVHLAMEARRRPTAGTMTAAELAQMLENFGWPFRNGSGGRPDAAMEMPRGKLSDDLEQAVREGRTGERRAEAAADAASDAAQDTERQALLDREAALVERIKEATLAWQKARQAVGKAPPDGKAAAEAQVKQAWEARNAIIAERQQVQAQISQQKDDRRERRMAASENAMRLRNVQRNIGPDYRAGEQLMQMLALWVRAAASDPNDPRNFTPLFLAEMGRLQDPPIDLAGSRFSRPRRGEGPPVDLRGAPRSQQLRLTLLEIQLIAAAFHRGAETRAAAPSRSWRDLFGLRPVVLHAQDPCSQFKDTLGKLVSSVAGQDAGTGATAVAGTAASEAAGKAIDAAVNAALDPSDAAAFGKAMGALSIAARIGKLVAFYDDTQVTVTADPASTHKPPDGPPLVSYTATAGLSEEDWKEYERLMSEQGAKVDAALRDCMDNLGLPTKAEVSDLAKEAENWLVEWRLVEGSPPHAWISLANNTFYVYGRLAMKLRRTGPYSAAAKLVVDILPEKQRNGKIVTTYVTARASVDAAGMPGLGIFVNLFKGAFGLAESLLELCVGWYQFMNQPKAYSTVAVDYHCGKPATLHQTDTPVADGGGDDGPDDCLVEAGK